MPAGSPRDPRRRRSRSRRAVLATASALALSPLAGCAGGDGAAGAANDGDADPDPNSGDEPTDEPTDTSTDEPTPESDGFDPSESTADLFDEEIPAHPGFIANPSVSGPGGDAELLVPFGISSRGDHDDFETFLVHIDEVVLDVDGGDAVSVPIDVGLDVHAHEDGGTVRGDTITVGWLLEIPAAFYTGVEYVMSPIEIVHESAGDLTDMFEAVGSRPLGNDGDGVEVEEEVLFRPMPDFAVADERYDDRIAFGPAGNTVGYHAMPRQYFDPSEYGE